MLDGSATNGRIRKGDLLQKPSVDPGDRMVGLDGTLIDNDRHPKVELVTHGVVGDYMGFRVEIQSKMRGMLDSKLFLFGDYMDVRDPSQRADDRPDYDGPFGVIASLGWAWYIAVPKHPEALGAANEQVGP